jgi:GDP-4-dehydro-6-deoxy-D-mannose reductase
MPNILVLGATGFVGSYLMELAIERGDSVIGTDYCATIDSRDYSGFHTHLRRCDIRYGTQLRSLLSDFQPDVIYHLAAQSFPALSWKAPEETLETNVLGTLNLYEAIRACKISPVVVVACSSAQYGDVAQEDIPVKESQPMRPLHSYGVSKVATELLALQYWHNFGVRSICARIFNTTGPRKQGDVCADFTARAVAIERGNHPPVLRVGNLSTYRAFTDVRDLVSALDLLSTRGDPGQVYNISGSRTYKIEEVLRLIRERSTSKFDIAVDEALLRPSDEPVIFGDSTKLVERTGWRQSIHLNQTVEDMLSYWRQRL